VCHDQATSLKGLAGPTPGDALRASSLAHADYKLPGLEVCEVGFEHADLIS
jgi:hypothetical protein